MVYRWAEAAEYAAPVKLIGQFPDARMALFGWVMAATGPKRRAAVGAMCRWRTCLPRGCWLS